MLTFAGCGLEPATFARWQQHFAPPAQPFFVSERLCRKLPAWPLFTRAEFERSAVPLSLRDTFTTYSIPREALWVAWLNYEAFSSLPRSVQAELLTEQRALGRGGVFGADETAGLEPGTLSALNLNGLFVWWPELWHRLGEAEKVRVLQTFVETDRLPCRRFELTPDAWARITERLPGAPELAGTFSLESGGNCLATVMAAFGVSAVAEVWVHPEPFERWLRAFSVPPEPTKEPSLGDVLVWRDGGRAQHAAVSLGEGYALHKEAQGWYAPRQVARFEDALGRWQGEGTLQIHAAHP